MKKIEGKSILSYINLVTKTFFDKGIKINQFSFWHIPYIQETNHFFIAGAPGSGKTQLLLPFIEQVRARGDICLIYDNKGDFTESLKDIENNPLYLIAPWDRRGVKWQIGEDIRNRQQAREFATNCIAMSEEPLYTTSARAILAGCIFLLQDKCGTNWGVPQLMKLVTLEREKLSSILKEYAPEASEMIREATKLTQNIMSNLYSAVTVLSDLKLAWENVTQSISISEILEDSNAKTILLQGNGLYKNMGNALIRSMIMQLAMKIESMPDDSSKRIWLFLDEFPQLEKIEGILPLLEIGRSKGVRIVIAAQNIDQLIHIYGESLTNSIQSMCQTHIYGRLSLGETANRICNQFGTATYEAVYPRLDHARKILGYDKKREQLSVISLDYLTSNLGVKATHINLIISGIKGQIFELKIPFYKKSKIRNKSEFADWLK